uniref:Syntrophin gamma 1 n=1 Tax=Equus asinus TaxID=9793 RepID=A0A9L0IK66_EQUAS
MDFRTACEETKTGICLLQDGNQEPFKVRLHLARDILMIQEQDVICVSGEPFYSGERTVTIRRQTVGGFGLSIKGGAEHNIPVVISKISKEQRAELSGLLFIGDAILQINGINVRKCRHEEVIKKINRNFPVNQQIVYMGWCEAREQDPLQDRVYSPTFLALRGSCLYKFLAPPVTTWDWTRAEKTFSVYEIMCKILKDSDLLDRRKHCFIVQSESGEDLYFSVELDCDLVQWERAFQTATFLEVERIQCKTYACVLESHLMGLTIDFSTGFICFDAATKAVLWRYKFSQLKGSSDDGKSKIKFLFQNPDTKQIEAKELEFSNLFAVLHCIHSFFAAKVACLDPLFLGSQATASATASSSTTSKAKYMT